MSRRQRVQSLRHRADQSGMLLAAANVPLTFQRTLMPRPTVDQAIVTGLSIATNHTLVSLVQESIQSSGAGGAPADEPALRQRRLGSRDRRARRVGDLRAGIGLQRAFKQRRRREAAVRAAARTGGFWLTTTGTAGAVIGGLQEAVGTFTRETPNTIPVVVPAAGVLAAVLELRRRRTRATRRRPAARRAGAVAPLKALGPRRRAWPRRCRPSASVSACSPTASHGSPRGCCR